MQAHCPGAAFPLLLPTDASLCSFEGWLSVGSKQLWLRLEGLPGLAGAAAAAPRPFAASALRCGPELGALLGAPTATAMQRCLHASSSLPAFLSDLRAAASACTPPPSLASGGARSTPALCALAEELAALPEGMLRDCSEDLGALRLRWTDGDGRVHLVGVELPLTYPIDPRAQPILLDHDLPEEPDLKSSSPGPAGEGRVQALLRRCAASAERYVPLWRELESVDASCWVLDPQESPCPRAATHRRLALGGPATLWLEMALPDAAGRAAAPRLRVDGPEGACAPFRARLEGKPPPPAQSERGWLLAWLMQVFGGALPGPPAEEEMAEAGGGGGPECVICYAFLCPQTNAPPGVECEGCARPFHNSCLAECLRAEAGPLAGAGAGYGTVGAALFGECPFCGVSICSR